MVIRVINIIVRIIWAISGVRVIRSIMSLLLLLGLEGLSELLRSLVTTISKEGLPSLSLNLNTRLMMRAWVNALLSAPTGIQSSNSVDPSRKTFWRYRRHSMRHISNGNGGGNVKLYS